MSLPEWENPPHRPCWNLRPQGGKGDNLLSRFWNMNTDMVSSISFQSKSFFYIKTYSKWNWKKYGGCRTISGHFFANCMNILYKTEVRKVILRCSTGLYLIWFKSYDTKCSMRLNAILAKLETLHKNLQLIDGRFTISFGHFFPNCMNIFYKTEVQTVIFRCLTGLNLNWFKSYETKPKKIQKCKKHNNVCLFNWVPGPECAYSSFGI
jgi:hypothetical protein